MRSGGTHTASRTTALVTVQLLRERERLSAPGSTEDNTILLKTSVLGLIPLVTGLLVHAAARPVRRSHISTKLRPSRKRHAYGFILTGFALPWAHQESDSSSQPVCAG